MKKALLSLLFMVGLFSISMAQYPSVTISDIQTVAAGDLAACIDSSALNGDTVIVTGIVMTHPDSSRFGAGSSDGCFGDRFDLWIQSDTTPFSGLEIIGFYDPNTNDIATLVPGDSVQITGVVEEYFNQTELVPLETVSVVPVGTTATFSPVVVPVGDLNDGSQANILPTGEQWENMYIEIQNVSVVSVDPFSGGSRTSFVVEDGSGNRINVSDKFIAQCLPAGCPAGGFVAPNVGDNFNYIRGILTHSANGCTGSSGRGYELHPTQVSDYDINTAAPRIFNVTRTGTCPASTADVTITADVTDPDGTVDTVYLKYAVGELTSIYTDLGMTRTSPGSDTWTADIPAQANGSFVKWYIEATDDSSNTSAFPNVPGSSDPNFYTVRDGGCTIFDIQYVPSTFSDDASGYESMTVTLTGVVTASAEPDNLGYVYIQEEGRISWAGIPLVGSTDLTTLKQGDKVEVTGIVSEFFGLTRLESVSSVLITGSGTINPVVQVPSLFSDYDFATNELYESMLMSLTGPTGDSIFVVEVNADDPSNFAEYRVGEDAFDPSSGSRVLAGRQTSSAFSSLNVSYVNDSSWASLDGTMKVDVCVVDLGMAIDTLTGIMTYSFGNLKLLPRNNDDFAGTFACPVDTGMSIYDNLVPGSINVFPNPANDRLNIDYSFDQFSGSVKAEMFDLMGRVVAGTELSGREGVTEIAVNGITPGTYILRVKDHSDNWMFTSKIIINR